MPPILADLEKTDMSGSDTTIPIAHAPGPHGLGGMLWLFGIPLLLWGTAMVAWLPLLLPAVRRRFRSKPGDSPPV